MKRKAARGKVKKGEPNSSIDMKNMSLKDLARELMNISRKAGCFLSRKNPTNVRSQQASDSTKPQKGKENVDGDKLPNKSVPTKIRGMRIYNAQKQNILTDRKLRTRIGMKEISSNCSNLVKGKALHSDNSSNNEKIAGEEPKAAANKTVNKKQKDKQKNALPEVVITAKNNLSDGSTRKRILDFSGLLDSNNIAAITNENIYDMDVYMEKESKQKRKTTCKVKQVRRKKSSPTVISQKGNADTNFSGHEKKGHISENHQNKVTRLKINIKKAPEAIVQNKKVSQLNPSAVAGVVLRKPLVPNNQSKKTASKRKLDFGTSRPVVVKSFSSGKIPAPSCSNLPKKAKETVTTRKTMCEKVINQDCQNSMTEYKASALINNQKTAVTDVVSKGTQGEQIISSKDLNALSPVHGITSFHEFDDAGPFAAMKDYVTSTPDKTNVAVTDSEFETRSLESILHLVKNASQKNNVSTGDVNDDDACYQLFFDMNENKRKQSLLDDEDILPVKKSKRTYASRSFKVNKKTAAKKSKKAKATEKKINEFAEEKNNHFLEFDIISF